MKRIKLAIEKRLSVITLVLLVIQPMLDVFSYFLSQAGSNTISTLLRFAILAAVAFLGFIASDRKKLYIALYSAALLFWILHAANCFRTGYKDPVSDAANYLRLLNYPIFTLSLIVLFKKCDGSRKMVYLGFAVNLLEIVVFTLLPKALGQEIYTYQSLGIGLMGWFSVSNAQSCILVLIPSIAIFWAYRTGKYPVFLLSCAVSFPLLYFTGTKLTFFSIFIICGAMVFLFVINLKGRSLKYVIPLLLIFAAAFIFKGYSPMMVREGMTDYTQGNYSTAVEEKLSESGTDVETIKELEKEEAGDKDEEDDAEAERKAYERLEKLRRALTAVYNDPDYYGGLFKNISERFGVYNVIEEYGYTSDTAVLSNTRTRKSAFAALVWKEKDLVTKLFGFEYAEMIYNDEIFDLENDFPAVFYFGGYIGFTLYLSVFVYMAWRVLRSCLAEIIACCREKRQRKPLGRIFGGFFGGVTRFLTLETGAVGITFLMAIISAQFSGNVLRRPNVTVYFSAATAILYMLTSKNKTEG